MFWNNTSSSSTPPITFAGPIFLARVCCSFQLLDGQMPSSIQQRSSGILARETEGPVDWEPHVWLERCTFISNYPVLELLFKQLEHLAEAATDIYMLSETKGPALPRRPAAEWWEDATWDQIPCRFNSSNHPALQAELAAQKIRKHVQPQKSQQYSAGRRRASCWFFLLTIHCCDFATEDAARRQSHITASAPKLATCLLEDGECMTKAHTTAVRFDSQITWATGKMQYNKTRFIQGRYRFWEFAVSVYMVWCAMQWLLLVGLGLSLGVEVGWLFLCRKDVHLSE